VIGQQQALAALTNIKHGPSEDITSYVRRFRVVCTQYVGNLLNDDTIRHYFIQGFSMPSTIRDILNMRPRNLEAAIFVALEVAVIDKENDRMLRRAEEPIPAFIPLYHPPNEFPRYPTMDYHHATRRLLNFNYKRKLTFKITFVFFPSLVAFVLQAQSPYITESEGTESHLTPTPSCDHNSCK
jgi:hypothetical protein